MKKLRYFWIIAKLDGETDIDTETVLIELLSVIVRRKGEFFNYLGKRWRVTECFPA